MRFPFAYLANKRRTVVLTPSGYVNHPDAFLSLAFPVMGVLPVGPSFAQSRR